jgi:hypothetical protein
MTCPKGFVALNVGRGRWELSSPASPASELIPLFRLGFKHKKISDDAQALYAVAQASKAQSARVRQGCNTPGFVVGHLFSDDPWNETPSRAYGVGYRDSDVTIHRR